MKTSLANDLNQELYKLGTNDVLTPLLVIYPALVRHNIKGMIEILGGDPSRWRPHLKTVKLESMIRLLVEANVTSAKCATTLELLTACQAGMRDVLVAYPHTGKNAERVTAIAREFPGVRVSAIVDSSEQVGEWANTPVDLFIDINTGMDRTGVEQDCIAAITRLAAQVQASGQTFRGVHFYDGNSTEPDLSERTRKAHARYSQLLQIVAAIETKGIPVKEVITSGTPALPAVLSFEGFRSASFVHQASPGTVVYNDASSLEQLPEEYGLMPAVLVISSVVSHPKPAVVTCDAGHKSVSVDSGVPNCVVLGKPDLRGMKPSEEHLPFEVVNGSPIPPLGTALYLLPRHVCPTVNNFTWAALVEHGKITAVDRVTARGREGPLPPG
jgi:D-serine deaminase-like pyridoxal phosphate-dependent protein